MIVYIYYYQKPTALVLFSPSGVATEDIVDERENSEQKQFFGQTVLQNFKNSRSFISKV